MKNPLKIDDSLIISRLEQKELSYIKPSMKEDSQFYLLMGKISLKPFINNLAINLGLNLQLLGDRIIQCQIESGYFYHDIETELGELSPRRAIFALERLRPDLPIFYQVALMLAYEELLGLTPDPDTSERYAIALEFARICHHLNICHNLFSFAKTNHLSWLTCQIQNHLTEPMKLSKRVVEQTPKSGLDWARVLHHLSEAWPLVEELTSLALASQELLISLKRKAVFSLTAAASLGLTGLFTRANRNNYDLRKSSRIAYQTATIPTTEGGDAWARFSLRLMDIQSSMKWLKKTINSLEPKSQLNALCVHDNFCSSEPTEKFSVGEVAGPEGDIRVTIFASPAEEKLIFRVRSPAYFIAQAIPQMLLGLRIEELPLILHSLGIRAEEVDK